MIKTLETIAALLKVNINTLLVYIGRLKNIYGVIQHIILIMVLYVITEKLHHNYCSGWLSIITMPTPFCKYLLWIMTNISNFSLVLYSIIFTNLLNKLLNMNSHINYKITREPYIYHEPEKTDIKNTNKKNNV